MGMTKPDIHDALQLRRTAGVFDHFNEYVSGSGHLWTSGGSGGSVSNPDGDGGILRLTTGREDQDAFFASTRKNWTFVAGKPMLAQIGLKYTEQNTDKAGIFFGFASSFVDILVDTTYALASPVSAVGIFKKPGDTLWSCCASVGATQLGKQSKCTCLAPGLIQELQVQVMIVGSYLEATFWAGAFGPAAVTTGVPGGQVPLLENTTSMGGLQPIKLVVPIASAAAMSLGASIKAGSGSSEVLDVDYIGAEYLAIP